MDPFTDERNIVHINVKQRNGRKCITTISGISYKMDLHKIIRYLKKSINTNGAVIQTNDFGDIIQLQGDVRNEVYTRLIDWNIVDKEDIRIHGA